MGNIDYGKLLSESARSVRTTPIRVYATRASAQKGVISFTRGEPDPLTLPVPDLAGSSVALGRDGMKIMLYGATRGYDPLREFIAQRMASKCGVETSPDQMLITSGSLQALYMFSAAVLDRGDAVIVETPTYPGALDSMRERGARFYTVPSGSAGMEVDAIPDAIKRAEADGAHVKFVYTIPSFMNPTGATLGEDRRRKLLEIADKYGIMVYEDDPYGEIRYDGTDPQKLIAIDAAMGGGRVVYAGSFSKTLSPGIRVGWAVGPEEIVSKMTMIKGCCDVSTSVIAQALVAQYCREGHLDPNIVKFVDSFRKKRDAMVSAFKRMIPKAEFTAPEGGYFLWVRIPGVDTVKLFDIAIEQGVAYVPGSAFYVDGGGADELRACFSFAGVSEIEMGVSRLADALKKYK